jgi:hypothetical protein
MRNISSERPFFALLASQVTSTSVVDVDPGCESLREFPELLPSILLREDAVIVDNLTGTTLPFPGAMLGCVGTEAQPRFLCDAMVGRLARRLRMLGYDAAYQPRGDDRDLLRRAARERRILVTRDTGIGCGNSRARVLLLSANDTAEQLRQVVAALGLAQPPGLFLRCTVCNVLLRKARCEEIETGVPEYVRRMQADFRACRSCGRVYWPGTHRQGMLRDLGLPTQN